jgi:hypothetical protein
VIDSEEREQLLHSGSVRFEHLSELLLECLFLLINRDVLIELCSGVQLTALVLIVVQLKNVENSILATVGCAECLKEGIATLSAQSSKTVRC